jgi:hypothetical protein
VGQSTKKDFETLAEQYASRISKAKDAARAVAAIAVEIDALGLTRAEKRALVDDIHRAMEPGVVGQSGRIILVSTLRGRLI